MIIAKKLAVALLPLLAVLPQTALAWGRTGHETVANIAELNLNTRARSEVAKLLALDGHTRMAQVATWADGQRENYPLVHTTRIPIDGSAAPTHACPDPQKLCADEAVNYYLTVLRSKSAPAADRYVALKFVIHLVGDLHQPLHGSDPAGYNKVTLNGSTVMEIHQVWDNVIIDQHGLNADALARELMNNGQDVGTGRTPRDWAVESSIGARDEVYDSLPACYPKKVPTCSSIPVALPSNYAQQHYPLVSRRLKRAGLRLTEVLNAALQD